MIIGDGIAVILSKEVIYELFNAVISMVAVTKRAFRITTDNGAEVLFNKRKKCKWLQ